MMLTDLRSIGSRGEVTCTESGLLELLYQDVSISGIACDDRRCTEEWRRAARDCDSQVAGPVTEEDRSSTDAAWFTPQPYSGIDLRQWCLDRCESEEQEIRAMMEIDEFEKRGMLPVMRHMIYCVDSWRTAGVTWGVGRGSSVSSFVLYLIGINRINPLLHDLDFGEWLK